MSRVARHIARWRSEARRTFGRCTHSSSSLDSALLDQRSFRSPIWRPNAYNTGIALRSSFQVLVASLIELIVSITHGLWLATTEHYLEVHRLKTVIVVSVNDAGG